MELFKPRGASHIRDPISNKKENGQIENPPRFSEIGGLESPNKATAKNTMMKLSKPGDTKKVI